MKLLLRNILIVATIPAAVTWGCGTNMSVPEGRSAIVEYQEPHRPQFHFTPPAMWMNDPNGMVYYQGEYHLFYQHYPDSTVWGPMHWGHAVSRDIVHWEHLPIALFPDTLGMIFSGSAVIDTQNTSGFGTQENPPMVAIFTYHHMEGERAGRDDFQTQGIAFSLDKGRSWTKYEGNPVLANSGIKDFRDPKVMWHEEAGKWIMSLAVYDHIRFYSSANLKDWQLESSFGEGVGAHGGVWECPDLFKLPVNETNEEKWVLLVSINPGGPNGGSATQYFIGDFDGRQFRLDPRFEERLAGESIIPAGEILTDFEDPGYGDWQLRGAAFGTGPAEGAFFGQDRVNNYVGKRIANSFKKEKGATGTLTSPFFTIEHNYINLMVGGQQNADTTAVRLLVNGEVLRSETGNDSESLEWVSWNVEELKGREAKIEIIDHSTESLGHILVDHIVFSEEPVNRLKKDGIFIDYGTDNYAGVTWANIPEEDGRRLFMGWMSNWDYGQVVPTETWRSAMTVARSLSLENTIDGLRLVSRPVQELQDLYKTSFTFGKKEIENRWTLSEEVPFTSATYELKLGLQAAEQAEGFSIELSNKRGQKLLIGYDADRKQYFIDRTEAGSSQHQFSSDFAGIHYAPRLAAGNTFDLLLLVDVASVELFADGGKTVMTAIFFPDEEFTRIKLHPGHGALRVNSGEITDLKSIWQPAN
jgi:fructan beta-fructosidase